jgi:hypothetical protein
MPAALAETLQFCNFLDNHFGSAIDCPWKLKMVAKHSLQVESRLGLTVAPAAAEPALSSGADLPLFTGILDHDLFSCSCKVELTVEPSASTGGRQMGQEPGQAGQNQNLG